MDSGIKYEFLSSRVRQFMLITAIYDMSRNIYWSFYVFEMSF